LRKKPALPLLLGGAAVYRCGSCLVLNSALAAEGTALDPKLFFRKLFSDAAESSRSDAPSRAADSF
jgi:hypothetical protein